MILHWPDPNKLFCSFGRSDFIKKLTQGDWFGLMIFEWYGMIHGLMYRNAISVIKIFGFMMMRCWNGWHRQYYINLLYNNEMLFIFILCFYLQLNIMHEMEFSVLGWRAPKQKINSILFLSAFNYLKKPTGLVFLEGKLCSIKPSSIITSISAISFEMAYRSKLPIARLPSVISTIFPS